VFARFRLGLIGLLADLSPSVSGSLYLPVPNQVVVAVLRDRLFVVYARIYVCTQWLKCKIKGGRTLHSGLGH